jgi:hypothetical protein
MTLWQGRLIEAVNRIIDQLPDHRLAVAVGFLRELGERRRADRMRPKKRLAIEAGRQYRGVLRPDGGGA